ncbi:MAG: hypothetical protein QOE35_3560 [Actinomycetota bacterium]
MKTVDVHSNYDEPAPETNGVRCPGITTGKVDCRLHDSGDAYFTGTFEGTAHFELESIVLTTDERTTGGKSYYEGDGNQFDDVVVAGCGHGAFHMDESDGYIDFNHYDPVTNSAPGYNKWSIRPGSGTGDLVGLAGEGENHWTFYLNGYLPTAGPRDGGKGLFTGSVTCPGPAQPAVLETHTQPRSSAAVAESPRGGSRSAVPPSDVLAARTSRVQPAAATSHVPSALSSTGAPMRAWLLWGVTLLLGGLATRLPRRSGAS